MTLEGELFTVSSNIHNHKNRTSLKGLPLFFLQTSAFLINCAIPNRSFFLVNTFSLTDREREREGGLEGKRKGEHWGEAEGSRGGGELNRGTRGGKNRGAKPNHESR